MENMKDGCLEDIMSELEEARKQLAYYKRLWEESGNRRLRETEELLRLIFKLKGAGREVEERNDRLVEANRSLEVEVKERKDAQLELQKSEETYKRIISESVVGIAVYNASGVCTAANQAFASFLGLPRREILQKNYHDLAFWEKAGLLYKAKHAIEENRTVRYEVKDGTEGAGERCFDCHLIPFLSGGLLLMVSDVSEKKRFTEKLFEAQKMEAIATLAGGIAHDFNNELFTITAYLDLLKIELSSRESSSKYLESMTSSAKRMALLTSQLLAYAHGGKYQPKAISMSRFVKNTIPIIRPMIQPDARLELDLPDGVPAVLADLTQMQMVLSAVISNASEAMTGEGVIRVVVRDERMDSVTGGENGGLEPGRYVSLKVEDTGSGMSEGTRKKIFEPFFSTKFEGRGLGMAAVHGIVRNHNGSILVESEMGKGTAVRIFFPVL